MFNKSLLKSIVYVFILLGIPYIYADTQTMSFYLVYGPGVNDVKFDHTNNNSSPSNAVKNVSTYDYSDSSTTVNQYKIVVKADIKGGNQDTTNAFNETYSSTAIKAAGTSADITAQNLDFSITGEAFIINGITLSNQFTIAHENYNSGHSGNWWVAGGSPNSNVIRFNDGSVALELTDTTGQNVFCLNQYGQGKINMLVASAGKCSNISYVSYHFNFIYEKKIESIEFIPTDLDPELKRGQVSSIVTTQSLDNSTKLTINAIPQTLPESSNWVANDFYVMTKDNDHCGVKSHSTSVTHFLIYQQGNYFCNDASNLDFFITGYLKINGHYVRRYFKGSGDGNGEILGLALAEGSNQWWAGVVSPEDSDSGYYFSEYKPGGAFYDNRALVGTDDNDDDDWLEYFFSSNSPNSFKIEFEGEE